MVVVRETLSDQVYNTIKRSIIEGEYVADRKLNEQSVAKDLNVSPTPVREAFKRLTSEGFLENKPYKGVYVKSYSNADIREAYLTRAKLQGLAVRLLIEKASDDDILALETILEDCIASNEKNISLKFYPFHAEIFNRCRSEVVLKATLTLNAIINIDVISRYDDHRSVEESISNQRELMALIRTRSADEAVKKIESMVESLMVHVLNIE